MKKNSCRFILNVFFSLFALNAVFGITNGDNGIHIRATLVGVLVKFNIFLSSGDNTSDIGLAGAMFVASGEACDNSDSGNSQNNFLHFF